MSRIHDVQRERVSVAYEGDEYEVLLRYAEDEAKKLQNKKDDQDEDGEVQTKRLWYAPWKKVKVESGAEKKVGLRNARIYAF